MEDLKIRVNSEAESEEAQCLFFELGYRWLGCHGSSYFKINDNFKYITAYMRGMSLAQGTNGDAKKEITTLESEKTALTINIERYKNAEVEANKTISSLRKSANSSKESLDWYNTRLPDNMLVRMQERHNRNRAN